MRTALIDADMVRYTLGFSCQRTEDDGTITTADDCSWKHSIDIFISSVMKNSKSQACKLYLTGKGNFRETVAKK